MVNPAGYMVMGFSGASADSYLNALYSWRLANGITADRPALLHAGQVHNLFNQIGDYSSKTLDPADGLSFWTVQQFSKDQLDFGGHGLGSSNRALKLSQPNHENESANSWNLAAGGIQWIWPGKDPDQ